MPKPSRPAGFVADVGRRLAAARKSLGLSAKEVCEAINVQQNTYSQWEHGKSVMDVAAAARMKQRFGITLDWIYSGDPSGLPMNCAEAAIRGAVCPLTMDHLADPKREAK